MAKRQAQSPAQAELASAERQLQHLVALNAELEASVAERATSEAAWNNERRIWRAMIDQVPDYLFVKDTQSRFVIANRAVASDLGLTPDALIGKTDFDVHPISQARQFFADEQSVITTGRAMIDIDEFIVDHDGRQKWLSTSKVPLRDEHENIIGLVGICRDVTERKRAEEQIHFMAHHDVLTGLPNRHTLMQRLSGAIEQAKRSGGSVTVIFIDLDRFKLVNDSMGHGAGDSLLKTVASRMLRCVRGSDTVVRLGGDEFVVLLSGADDRADPKLVLSRLRAAIAESVEIEGQLFRVTSSIGVARYPTDGEDAETLLLNADVAMYQAKELGRDACQFYTAEMNAASHERRLLQEGLRQAIATHQFALQYQPQIDLRNGTIFAVEALVRWHHPELGVILPSKFIPMAEESGLIVPLGDWVLREACRQNKAWQEAGMLPISVCVNVSARQFRERNWVSRVEEILKETGLAPEYLELELTESLLMHDVGQAIATMRELQAIGVHFSIDDFGTGYSSLSALKSFPVARLKIDQSFVKNLPSDDNDRSIATAVISLGQKLHMRVIAEGVETQEQMDFLRSHDCDEFQGYHFSRPVDPSMVADLLRQQVKV
jgi:diguanylate cyclase (GGDEF)-like protein/PAS domain S-box-containing protein